MSPAVLLTTPWRHADAVPAAAAAIRRLLRPDALLECRVIAPIGSDSDALLFAQLSLLRALGLPARSLHQILADSTGHEAVAELDGGARAALSAVFTEAVDAVAQVELIDAAGSVLLTVRSGDDARPSDCIVDDESGCHRTAAAFESPLRTAMRTLHRLADTSETHNELDGFAEDARLLLGSRP